MSDRSLPDGTRNERGASGSEASTLSLANQHKHGSLTVDSTIESPAEHIRNALQILSVPFASSRVLAMYRVDDVNAIQTRLRAALAAIERSAVRLCADVDLHPMEIPADARKIERYSITPEHYGPGLPIKAFDIVTRTWRPAVVMEDAPYAKGECGGAYVSWTDIAPTAPSDLSRGGWVPSQNIKLNDV